MKSYCPDCNKKTPCVIKSKPMYLENKFGIVGYVEHEAYCEMCGREVYIPDIHDENCEARAKAMLMVKEDA